MSTTARTTRIVAIALAVGLLTAIIVPLATRAGQQSIAMAPGDQLLITCETSFSGVVEGKQATVDCAPLPAPPPAPEPPPADGPVISELRGVHEGATLAGNVAIEAIVPSANIVRVVFELSGPQSIRHTERTAPYFFLGDNNGAPNGWDTAGVPDGAYSLTVTAINRRGERSATTVNFAIANAVAPPAPEPTQVPAPEPTQVPPAPEPTQVPPAPEPPPSGETPVAGQLCPAWVHDRHVVTGPDGNIYPTWHPPVDPEFGCLFGHEHGSDPRTSGADNTLPAFGYAGVLAGLNEPHEGFKVFTLNAGQIADDGRRLQADYRIVFHMGTARTGRYTTQFHSMEYDYVARDGSGREAHVYGMADTGTQHGSTCDSPRRGGRDFSSLGCDDPYEIWTFAFKIMHPDDPYTDPQHVRAYLSGSVAAFDPITTRDPADTSRLIFTQDYRRPGSGIDPASPEAEFQGCKREAYGGPNFWANAGRSTTYYTDPYGRVQPGPGPGLILQQISAVDSRSNEIYKVPESFCGNGIRFPN